MTWDTQEQCIESYEEMHAREIREERAAWATLQSKIADLLDFAESNPYTRNRDVIGWIQRMDETRRPEAHRPLPASNKRKMLPAKIRTSVFERDEYRCRHCGDHRDLTIDHVVPVVRGGSDDVENLQTPCKPCNSSKRDRPNVTRTIP